jgi:hypothetical protein
VEHKTLKIICFATLAAVTSVKLVILILNIVALVVD